MKPGLPKKIGVPPVMKLLFRGYLIISFILAMEYFDIIGNVPFIIFLITMVSISMVFGVGFLLVRSGPVRSCSYDIPGTALFFVKGIIVLYFVSLLAEFGILSPSITSIATMAVAIFLVIAGVLSYIYEVFERSRPVPRAPPAPRIRKGPYVRS